MNNKEDGIYWQKVVGDKTLKMDLQELKNVAGGVFQIESDNYKQKLVYNLLEAVKNNDQNQFFYLLLKAINKPKENFKRLWYILKENYDVMPDEAFMNFAYTIIIGIMSTYSGDKKMNEEEVKRQEENGGEINE